MINRFALLLVPALVFAQSTESETEKTLRTRVTEFYQLHVDGNFRKAEPYIAEDTKDYYYSVGKLRFQSFTVGKITVASDAQKAVVEVVGKTERLVGGQPVVVDMPMQTNWKIENGQWVWTFDPKSVCATPMCGATPSVDPKARIAPPKDVSQAALQARAQEIIRQQEPSKLDRNTVTFTIGKAATEQVTFTSGSISEVMVGLQGPVVKGFSWQFDHMMVKGHDKAVLTLKYDPADKGAIRDAWDPKGTIEFTLVEQPLSRTMPLMVKFEEPKQAASK